MQTNRITTIGDYVEALKECDRIIIQVTRPGLPISPGRFWALCPKNMSDNDRLVLDAIKDQEVEELTFENPVINV